MFYVASYFLAEMNVSEAASFLVNTVDVGTYCHLSLVILVSEDDQI